ncbi:hypothetical protein QFC21_002175 [Naganishia friedmannii]|uniref:Uncharacterized protein n=1 Tax=Naganishia friedmannii TaxID=89922 RepID=A0ACC2VZB1_9TREE|nr:hypothetical protein QFC21_002175 [Naganishia friedmannii]
MSDSPSINDAETVAQKQQTVSPVKSFLSGAAGGHPFDLTKTRLQTAPKGTYGGAMDVVRQTLARDGVRGPLENLFYGLLDAAAWRTSANLFTSHARAEHRSSKHGTTGRPPFAGAARSHESSRIHGPRRESAFSDIRFEACVLQKPV